MSSSYSPHEADVAEYLTACYGVFPAEMGKNQLEPNRVWGGGQSRTHQRQTLTLAK